MTASHTAEKPGRPIPKETKTRTLQAHVDARGGAWLDGDYTVGNAALTLRCARGHQWHTRARYILAGNWCPHCARRDNSKRRRAVERLRSIIAEHSGEWIAGEYEGERTAIGLRCALGHEWLAKPRNIFSGFWCPKCRAPHPAQRKAARRLAETIHAHGGVWIHGEYHGQTRPVWLRCARGHEWQATPAAILRGGWCRLCNLDHHPHRRRAMETLRRTAAERGGAWIGGEYQGRKRQVQFRCAKGHEWWSSPASVLEGSWCPDCVRSSHQQRRAAMERLRRAVAEHGGEWLDGEYVTVHSRLRFRCARGHEWEAQARRVISGAWCVRCRAPHTKRPLSPREHRQALDRLLGIVARHGGELLEDDYKGRDTPHWFLCGRGHQWQMTPAQARDGMWCQHCRWRPTLQRIQAAAAARGGVCLTTEPGPLAGLYRFRCSEGHEWQTTGTIVAHGSWCPTCGHLQHTRYDLAALGRLAAEHDGRCLSTRYPGYNGLAEWQCANDHRWKAAPAAVIRGTWCRECARAQRCARRLEELRRIAADRGGRCLSETYTRTTEKLAWQCHKGHFWRATPASIKRGSWCPECANEARRVRKRRKRGKGVPILLGPS